MKNTLLALLVLTPIWLAMPAGAEPDEELNPMQQEIADAAICSAFLSISITNTQDSYVIDTVTEAANWWAERSRNAATGRFSDQELNELGLDSADDIANMAIHTNLKTIQKYYNDGTWSWNDIKGKANQCFMAWRLEVGYPED